MTDSAELQSEFERALAAASPLTDDLRDRLIGHDALTIAVVAAYCLRAYEATIGGAGVGGRAAEWPRAKNLAFVSALADRIELIATPVSSGN